MYKKYKIVNLRFLPDFNFGLLGCSLLEMFGWIYFLSLGLTPCKLVLTFALCFPTCVTYIVLDGNGVTGRGAHGGIILGGWLDWSVIRLVGPLRPVPTCLTYKATPSWVRSETHFSFFLLCYQNRNPQMGTLYFSSLHMGMSGVEHSAQGRKQKRSAGSASGSPCVCLSLLSHDISTGRIRFTRKSRDPEAWGHLIQNSVIPWVLNSHPVVVTPVQS